MSIARRTFIEGLIAGGALWAAPASLTFAYAARSDAPLAVLVSGGADAANAAFVAGARAAAGSAGATLQLTHVDPLRAAREATGVFAQGARLRVLAFMDVARAIVFEEVAYSADARLLSRGEHTCSTGETRAVRSLLVAASASHAVAAKLASRLRRVDISFVVTENVLGAADAQCFSAQCKRGATPFAEEWLTALGFAATAAALDIRDTDAPWASHAAPAHQFQPSCSEAAQRWATVAVEI